jgi:DNA-binding NtrC family response regulator
MDPVHTVLLVDDQPAELLQVEVPLSGTYRIKKAANISDAKRELGGVGVVCVSFRPKGIDAIGLARDVVTHPSAAVAIVMAKYDEYSAHTLQNKRSDDKFYLLFRPFKPEQLVDLVKRAFQTFEMKRQMQRLAEMTRPQKAKV